MNALFPLGDQAVLGYFADENSALRFAARLRHATVPWVIDVVQAYTSVAVYFNLDRINFAKASEYLERLDHDEPFLGNLTEARLHHIPCCYELELDMARVVEHTGLPAEAVVRLHTETEYTVYAIGFCPGFPYLGYLPQPLCGVPRLSAPRLQVEAGSVGLTGRQTGIYTETRPGGWNLIGRTPLQLVNVADGYFPLRTGDRIRFESIDEEEFRRLLGERL